MALCCDLGVFSKRIIGPVANILTDSLHIPGGIGTSFSIMFVLVGAESCGIPGCAVLMCCVQSMIALAIGTTGSMGALAPIGYILPGLAMELCMLVRKRWMLYSSDAIAITNALASMAAALAANFITFGLKGVVLLLYLSVSGTSGLLFGYLGSKIIKRLKLVIRFND